MHTILFRFALLAAAFVPPSEAAPPPKEKTAPGQSAEVRREVRKLSKLYAAQEKWLPGARHFVRTAEEDGGQIREEAWELETGEIIKLLREVRKPNLTALDESSLHGGGAVYFTFRKVTVPQPDGGVQVTEYRSYFGDDNRDSQTRRTATFPAGAAPEIPAGAPQELILAEADKPPQIDENEFIDRVVDPKFLVRDPAKDAPADWQRVRLIKESLSPDGRYALALSPDKKDFKWEDFEMGNAGQYFVDLADAECKNYIVDLKTHRVLGETPANWFGNLSTYNLRSHYTIWSPDSRTFVQITTEKWFYSSCSIGRVEDGKLIGIRDLGEIVGKRTEAFLAATKHRGYRKHKENMMPAVHGEDVEFKDDHSGTVAITFQVMKSDEDDAYVTVDVGFRVVPGKKGFTVETTSAKLVPNE